MVTLCTAWRGLLSFTVCVDTLVMSTCVATRLLAFQKRVGGFSSPEGLFPGGVPRSKEFRRGELDGREPVPVALDSRLCCGSCFIPLLYPRKH